MRTTIGTAVMTIGLVAAGGAWHHFHAASDRPRIAYSTVARGDVVQSVACSGTLTTHVAVDVGSQVSGTVAELHADFNSVVHKGDILARLDPGLFDARVQQARGALAVATASVETDQAAIADASEKLGRAETLADRQLIPQSDLDDAMVAMREAQAQLHADEGGVEAARGVLDQCEVDLSHTVITSPVDGVVIDRKVDAGQTVAAGFQAPSLFSVATDLSRLEVEAAVDESDIGQVRTGQRARFSVDAYPRQEFEGTVTQVRLQPAVVQNVVSYTAVVAVDNRNLALRPGMTATVSIDVDAHRDTLEVPTVALMFRPNEAVLRALGEEALSHAAARVPVVFRSGTAAQVWVGRNGRLEPRTVHVGLSDGRFTEVLDGLGVGTPVVVSAFAAPTAPVANAPSPLAPRMWRGR
jgi:HlyD family secretion protein